MTNCLLSFIYFGIFLFFLNSLLFIGFSLKARKAIGYLVSKSFLFRILLKVFDSIIYVVGFLMIDRVYVAHILVFLEVP